MIERQLYSVSEFCRRNTISRDTFYKLLKTGRISAVKVGGRTLVPAEVERAWHASLPIYMPQSEHLIQASIKRRLRIVDEE